MRVGWHSPFKNITDFWRFCYLKIPCLRINIPLIFMSSSSEEFTHKWGKAKTCFCWFSAAIFVPLKERQTWRLHTKLYKFGLNVFPNISHMNYCIDLILGKGFCIFIFFHFPYSRLSVLKGFHFYFSFLTWVKTENSLEQLVILSSCPLSMIIIYFL